MSTKSLPIAPTYRNQPSQACNIRHLSVSTGRQSEECSTHELSIGYLLLPAKFTAAGAGELTRMDARCPHTKTRAPRTRKGPLLGVRTTVRKTRSLAINAIRTTHSRPVVAYAAVFARCFFTGCLPPETRIVARSTRRCLPSEHTIPEAATVSLHQGLPARTAGTGECAVEGYLASGDV